MKGLLFGKKLDVVAIPRTAKGERKAIKFEDCAEELFKIIMTYDEPLSEEDDKVL